MSGGPSWTFSSEVHPSLPQLAWIATIRPGSVQVACGVSVRTEPGGVFEGAWGGDPILTSVADATTVFGSGLVARGPELMAIGPSHTLEAIYAVNEGSRLVVSNSFVGVLARAGLELNPAVLYPPVLLQAARLKWFPQDTARGPLHGARIGIPTLGRPVSAYFYENVLIRPNLRTEIVAKPRERTFESFDDYRKRLFAMTASVFANARPREPIVALSSGYDSTAVAAVASELGCRRSVTFREGKPSARGARVDDSGAAAAAALGLEMTSFDRLAYRRRNDLPEAEFLATGMSGEDVIVRALEDEVRGHILLTGYWSGHVWHKFTAPFGRHSMPPEVGGASMTEFRLRTDFIHVPLPYFGAIQAPQMSTMATDPDMAPFHVGGAYDRPVPRRLAEEAGVERGTFALSKRAANATLHRDGEAAFAPQTLAAIRAFAERHGSTFNYPPRPAFGRRHRAALRVAHKLRADGLVGRLINRRRSLVHFDPQIGSLLFRWAVSVIRPRYQAVSATVAPDEQR